MFRLMSLTFYGAPRADARVLSHVHESPKVMTIPLVVLAAGSALAGWIGVPRLWSILPDGFRVFEHWLAASLGSELADSAAEHSPETATEWLLMGLSVAVALAGIAVARHLYVRRPARAEALRQAAGPLYTWALNKWYVDEAYDFLFVNGLGKGGGSALVRFDDRIVDGGVNGAGWLTRLTSQLSIWWDTWVVDGAVRLTSFLVKLSSYPVRIIQTGSVQAYALVIVLGAAALFGYYLVR